MLLASREQDKKSDKLAGTSYAFTDSNGMKYYRFVDDMEIPIERKGCIELSLNQLSNGLHNEELELLMQGMEKAINKDRPDIAMIGHLIQEIRDRKKLILHPEIFMDMVSYLYIREDEDPAVVDMDIHKAKIKQFRQDQKDKLYVFFYSAGLGNYIPYLNKLESEWKTYMEEGRREALAISKQVGRYISEPT